MKKYFVPFLLNILLIPVGFSLEAAAPLYLRVADKQSFERRELKKVPGKVSGGITLTAPVKNAEVPTLNTGHLAYINMPRKERIAFFASKSKRKQLRKAGFYQQPVKLIWNCSGKAPHRHTVLISENPALADAATFTVRTNQLALDNFKIAQKYYWQVTCNKNMTSEISNFTTGAAAPRLLRIESMWNVRDLGGRIGLNGRRVRQGLIYRSGGLNANAPMIKEKPQIAFKNAPELMKKYQKYIAVINECKKHLAAKRQTDYITEKILKDQWLVYIPSKHITDEEILKYHAGNIPAEARPVTSDRNGRISFAARDHGCAFFYQEFDSPADGFIQIGSGSDWFCYITVNGRCILDTLAGGNRRTPVGAENYIVEVPVKKGKNLMIATVRSGAASWSFACKQPEINKSTAHALKDMISWNTAASRAMLPYSRDVKPGRVLLNSETKKYVTCDLNWKNDIDLRSKFECAGMTGSPAGSSVKWLNHSFLGYAALLSEDGKAAFKKVFKIFLDRKNYPLVFHCIGGQDRTGSLAFVLNALLGVSEEELFLDWEVSGFWNSSPRFNHRVFFPLVKVFSRYPGNTINRRVENFVLSLGFTAKDINIFRAIMLEKQQ